MTKIKRVKDNNGYILIKKPEHPASYRTGFIPEHRFIMEQKIGRYLRGEEVVHHINGVKDDNRIENLLLCKNQKEHFKYHSNMRKIDGVWFKKCTSCGLELEANFNNFGKTVRGGFTPQCKTCIKEFQRKYYLKHKKKLNKANNEYRRKHKEKLKKYAKEYRKEHQDVIQKWRKKNREHLLNLYREYNKKRIKKK